jgi:BASS family bile acid:Na+ symporter
VSLSEIILLLVTVSIVVSVFAIGLKSTFADVLHLFRSPVELLRAVLAMNVLMPLFAAAVVLTFNLHVALRLALIVLSVSPIPPILPNRAVKAGGKENYVIGLLVAISTLSVIVIPITMEVFQWLSGVPLRAGVGEVFVKVAVTVLIPLIVGIICRRLSVSIADRAARPLALIGTIMLVLCCLPILFTSFKAVMTLIGDGTLLALSAFALVGMLIGHLLGGPKPSNRAVLALATSTRHPAVAMTIAHINFPDQKLAAPLILVYLVISFILFVPYINWMRRTHSQRPQTEKPVQV